MLQSFRIPLLALCPVLLLLVGCGSDRAPEQDNSTAAVGEIDTYATQGSIDPTELAKVTGLKTMVEMQAGLAELPKDTTIYLHSYPDTKPQAMGYLNKDQPIGEWVYWHPNGNIAMRGAYVYEGLETGDWIRYYENGSRMQQGTYHRGQMVGEWWFWHDNGHRQMHGAFHNGKETGKWTTWHDNNSRASEGQFIQGRKAGLWLTWDRQGRLVNKTDYHHPIPPRQAVVTRDKKFRK